MASRTTMGPGIAITMTLTGALLIAAFITAVVFYGKAQRAVKDTADLRAQHAAIVRAGEENDDEVAALLAEAQRSGQSLVMYLKNSQRETMRRVTGDADDSLTDFQQKTESIEGANSSSLLRVISERDRQISGLDRTLQESRAAQQAAQSDLQAEVDRVSRLRDDHTATLAALNDEIGRYRSELDVYRNSVHDTIGANEERVSAIRNTASETENALRERLRELNETILIQTDTLESLRLAQRGNTLQPANEATLVDARIISTDPQSGRVFIDIGRNNRVVLGMTFKVYSEASSIRPDASGNYPAGRGIVEVIRVDETSSVCRIIGGGRRGNPIVTGDILANAIYDPNKIYEFVVFGNYDANRDGLSTPHEANSIKSVIKSWGGRVTDDINGRTDFLVLGEKPIVPPAPPGDADIAVIQAYIYQQRGAEEYDRLFRTAVQTNIPILNENRLYTLTGYTGAN